MRGHHCLRYLPKIMHTPIEQDFKPPYPKYFDDFSKFLKNLLISSFTISFA